METHIVTYPTYAIPVEGNAWRLNIAGLVYETPPLTIRQKMLVRLLGKRMRVEPAELESPLFRRRVAPFFHEPQKRVEMIVRLGGEEFRLHRGTRSNGSFVDWMRLSSRAIDALAETDHDGHQLVRYQVTTSDGSAQPAEGVIRLVPSHGLSVISDIDDTIKETLVDDRRELLVNTFLRTFRPVEGMADVYRRMYREGAEFHYVSSSPWQLFHALQEHQSITGFPPGTMHLRYFRLRDQFLKKMLILRRKGKATTIRRILQHFPDRQFILIGDSGEKDPEIYRKMAARFDRQILGIFVRELPSRPMDYERRRRLQRLSAATAVRIFKTPEELEQEIASLAAVPAAPG